MHYPSNALSNTQSAALGVHPMVPPPVHGAFHDLVEVSIYLQCPLKELV